MSGVLVVDDDAAVAEAVRFVLTRAGYTVKTASTIAEGRAHTAEGGFSVAVIDVWMDHEDGLELATDLSQAGLPFIVMSGGGPGRTLESMTARADALGAVRVLFKPFDDDELLSAIDAALASGGSEYARV